MVNEYLFLAQIALVSSLALLAVRQGKEALIALITLYCVLANAFVTKQMSLCGLNATCTDSFMIGAVLGLNLLQEYYGKAAARQAIIISFGGSLVYALMSFVHVLYLPSMSDTNHIHYAAILTPIPRIVIASLLVYLTVQVVDYHLFGALRKRLGKKWLVGRLWLSIGLTQLLDTVLFSFAGLYGIISNIGQLIIISYAIKMLVLIGATPFMWLTKKLIQEPAK